MTTDEEKLEEQIAAQEAGDAEAAKEAATGSHYPPPIEEPAVTPGGDEPEMVDENAEQDTGLMDDMAIQLIRLTNGEWILGQFKIVQDPQGNRMLAFNKAFRFAMAPNQQGQLQPQVSPWPAVAGTIELHEISATGFTKHGWDGMDLTELYKQIVSPVAIAGRRQMAEELAKKQRAEAILNAGQQGGRGSRRR